MVAAQNESLDRGARRAVTRVVAVLGLGGVTGVLAALLATGFVDAVLWLNDWLLVSPRSRMMFAYPELLLVATVAVPTLGGLVVGLLHRGIAERRAHTPADVIATVQTRRGVLGIRAGTLSALSALTSLGCGASVGQYGPLVHMGATLGAALSRGLSFARSERNIIAACGVAAAIATAFTAPIAGILFAHEVVLRHSALRAFAPVAAAAIAGYVIADVVFARGALFYVDAATVEHAWEYAVFVAIGLGGALVAVTYMQAILAVSRHAHWLRLPPILRPALAGAAIGITALWLPDILGIGKDTLRFATIESAYGGIEVGVILIAKLFATALCIGLGFGGGVFSPALVIGALFGAACGMAVEALGGGTDTALVVYAVCGMVAVTAPVLGAPLATLLIIFELTGNYTLTTAALASVTLANLTASRLFGRSLFDVQLRAKGLDLSAGRSRAILQQEPVREHVTPDCVTVAPSTPAAVVMTRLGEAGLAEAFVIDDNGRYLGVVTLARLQAERDASDSSVPVADRLLAQRPLLTAQTSVWDAMGLLQSFVGEAIAVVDDDANRKFLGVIYEAAITRSYLQTVDELRREEHGSR